MICYKISFQAAKPKEIKKVRFVQDEQFIESNSNINDDSESSQPIWTNKIQIIESDSEYTQSVPEVS